MNAMDCKDIKALLSALIDDELDAPQRHLAERHLADCTDCRALVNQAESVDELIATETTLGTAATLPAGFEERVLSRTIFAHAPRPYSHRLSTWTGWLAAAACLALALTIWVSDHSGTINQPRTGSSGLAMGPTDDDPAIQRTVLRGPLFRSFVHVGTLPVEPEPVQAPPSATTLVSRPPAERADGAPFGAPPSTWDDDELTLSGASMLLAMLDDADTDSFADIERIRSIAEYDELLPRLVDARDRLPAASRPPVLMAESILHRIVYGPVSLDDVESLRETAIELQLADEVQSISHRWNHSSSA